MAYTDTHARALALVTKKGAAVTFTRVTRTYTASTDTSTISTSTVAGYAVRIPGNPKVYEALKLIPETAPTLLFAPSTYDGLPDVGDTVSWDSTTYTVRSVQPIAPDGNNLLARVVVSV